MDIEEKTIFLSAHIPINWKRLTILDALLPSLNSERIGWIRVFADGSKCVILPRRDALWAESQLGAGLYGSSVRLWMRWGSESKVAYGRLSISNVLEDISLRRLVVGEGLMQFLLPQKLDSARTMTDLMEARQTYPKSTTGRQLESALITGAALALSVDDRTKLIKKRRCIMKTR